ncbi:MAG TPA: asparaginase, partial [Actinomycetota bacterium]|nr:asparaginase [Actinomycetota bacterium]
MRPPSIRLRRRPPADPGSLSAPLARVIRSGVVESVHLGSVAVADAAGGLLAWSGDPSGDVFARSCMKPLQAAVSLSFVEEALSEEEVAVMCASHNAETIHLDAVEALLARGGRRAGDLRCPPAWPMDPARAREVEAPESRYHDCSGKHAGMLLACSRAEMDPAGYLDRDHPLHRAVMRAIPDAAGAEPSAIGTDGCGVPVHALPLAGLATMYTR